CPRVPVARFADVSLAWDQLPLAAAERLSRGEWPGRIYNDFTWGGYLIWKLYPRRQVFIDGRTEVHFDSGAFDDCITISELRSGWEKTLDRRRIEVVVTDRSGALAGEMLHLPGWRLVFDEPPSSVFTRSAPLQ